MRKNKYEKTEIHNTININSDVKMSGTTDANENRPIHKNENENENTEKKPISPLVVIPIVVGVIAVLVAVLALLFDNGIFWRLFPPTDGGTETSQTTSQENSTTESSVPLKNTDDLYNTTVNVYFDANGGNVQLSSIRVIFGSPYNELPTPSRTGYTFAGWFTSQNGGQQISSYDIVNTSSNHTLYAHWNANVFTLTLNANGGSTSTTKELSYGESYGTLPTPQKDYYTFDGWYTAVSGGSKVTSTTIMGDSDVTVYAHWTENSLSGWVLESDVPLGAQIVDQKWTYTKMDTDYFTSPPSDDWTKTGNYMWEAVDSKTHQYANFPSGFSTSDLLYKQYNKPAFSSSVSSDTKREVSDPSHITYIYWHWNYTLRDSSPPDNRYIGSYYGEKTPVGTVTHFSAFELNENCGHTDSKGATSDECYYYNTGNNDDVSWWWYRFSVYKQTYTDYKKVYEYIKVTENIESYSQVIAGGEISNVQKYVRYRMK